MYTRRLIFLLLPIILFGFCLPLLSWSQGIIVFSYRGSTYRMRPNDVEPMRITEEGFSAPSPDGRFLAATDSDPDRRDILHIRDLHTGKRIRSFRLTVSIFSRLRLKRSDV